MALWQILSITCVIVVGAAAFLGLAWWYLRRFHNDVIPAEPISSPVASAPEGPGKAPAGSWSQNPADSNTENRLLARMAQDIISTSPSAAELPERLRGAAQAAREKAQAAAKKALAGEIFKAVEECEQLLLSGFPPGAKVVLHGLQSNMEFNGCHGKVVEHFKDSERYEVRMDSGQLLRVQEENLVMIEESESLVKNNDQSSAPADLSEEGIESNVPRDPFLLSTDFNELRLKDLLGVGGFGRVQLVEELHNNTVPPPTAAWKALEKTYSEKTGTKWSLLMEKRIFAVTKLCPSPFLVSYYGCCQTPRYVYFKTEALLGGELYQTYKKNKFYGMEDKARYYMACAMTAMKHLHKLHVMLRSLKPEDCGLALDGTLKLFDFGLSKFVVHKTFTTCGTPDYFSPEIISAKGHAFPVDWWCSGVMLYELLAGDPPFASDYPMQIYQKVVKGINQITFPTTVSSSAKNLICTLCDSEPSARLPVAKGFEALQKHSFFKGFDWGGLSSMPPPYVPDANTKNYNANEADLPACFKSSPGPELAGEFWTTHFGPMGEDNDFPSVM